MDSDDEEMRDASSSSSMEGGGFEGEEEQAAAAAGGVMTLEVTWFQVDPDYEFDAPKWFDLAREEAPEAAAAAAQRWFASAPDYPPSRAYPPLLFTIPSLSDFLISPISFVCCSVNRYDAS
jgi:hypothetical protein